jgi:DNA-binding SARP family transcriptional activator
MARFDEDAANFREAHDWCEQDASRLELSLRLAVALHWYWFARGRFNEGRLRVGIALTFSDGIDPVLRGRALAVLGRLSLWQGDHAHVRQPMEQAVRLLRPQGDRASLSYAIHGLAIAELLHGRGDEARRLMDESESLLDAGQVSSLAPWIEYWRGVLAEHAGDVAAARQAYERALGAARRIGHKTAIGHALCATGRMLAAAGTAGDADRMLREALAMFRDIEDRWGIEAALQGLARTAALAGRTDAAAALLGAADLIREELGIDQLPGAKAYEDATTAAVLARIAEPAFWCAWKEGRHKPLSDLVTDVPPDPIDAGAPARVDVTPQLFDLRIRTLGGFDVWARNRRVERSAWGSSRSRELLAFLACHGEGRTKGQIGLALWPDASPAQLRNTFHVTLHRLRRALAIPDVIEVDGERYRLNPAVSREFDAQIFEDDVRAALRELRRGVDATARLAQAAARYRGDFLAGETVGEWADEHRDRLRELQAEALDALGRAHMERERYVEAADAFRTLLTLDPVNEEACRRQMTCLAQIGDRAGALRAYDGLVRALREELGVRPERETTVLRERLFSAT